MKTEILGILLSRTCVRFTSVALSKTAVHSKHKSLKAPDSSKRIGDYSWMVHSELAAGALAAHKAG